MMKKAARHSRRPSIQRANAGLCHRPIICGMRSAVPSGQARNDDERGVQIYSINVNCPDRFENPKNVGYDCQ
jgi:hypothetical protein